MIIIIEGPDGSGKTSLANKLRTQTGYHIIHRSRPKTLQEKLDMLEMYKSTILAGENVIFDRCWYSEMVYGPIMRDISYISTSGMYALEKLLVDKGALIIHCSADPEVLWERCKSRGEDYIKDFDTLLRIKLAFDELMDLPHLVPVVSYAYKEV